MAALRRESYPATVLLGIRKVLCVFAASIGLMPLLSSSVLAVCAVDTQCITSRDYPQINFLNSNVRFQAGTTVPLSSLVSYTPSVNPDVTGAIGYLDLYPSAGYVINTPGPRYSIGQGGVEYVISFQPSIFDFQYVDTYGVAPPSWTSVTITFTETRNTIGIQGIVLLDFAQYSRCFPDPFAPPGVGYYYPDGYHVASCTMGTTPVARNVGPQFTFSGTVTSGTSAACLVSNLSPITDADAKIFEAAAPKTPPSSLIPLEVDDVLSNRISNFMSNLASLGIAATRTSGYRPTAYQEHLWELRTKSKALQEAIKADASQATACAALQKALDFEISERHGIVRGADDLPKVNPASSSTHTLKPSQAVDLGGLEKLPASQHPEIAAAAMLSGLRRPCPTDLVHFSLNAIACSQTIRATAFSPLNILITDPSGRLVGFDPSTRKVVNEIGPQAWYSGPGSEPQYIEISDTIPGSYELSGVGIGAGPYQLNLDRVDPDGVALDSQVVIGQVVVGTTVKLTTSVTSPIEIDIRPHRRHKTIHLGSHGLLAVGILSTATFSAPKSVNRESLAFGKTGDEKSLEFCRRRARDINNDGNPDLVCFFRVGATGFGVNDTQGVLRGALIDATPVEGNDWVEVVNRKERDWEKNEDERYWNDQ